MSLVEGHAEIANPLSLHPRRAIAQAVVPDPAEAGTFGRRSATLAVCGSKVRGVRSEQALDDAVHDLVGRRGDVDDDATLVGLQGFRGSRSAKRAKRAAWKWPRRAARRRSDQARVAVEVNQNEVGRCAAQDIAVPAAQRRAAHDRFRALLAVAR